MEASSNPIDAFFYAMADATRRQVVMHLAQGQASVSELAKSFTMALPSLMQHLAVLETCGIIRTQKLGRVRTCYLKPESLSQGQDWLGAQKKIWESRLNQLDDYLIQLQEQQNE